VCTRCGVHVTKQLLGGVPRTPTWEMLGPHLSQPLATTHAAKALGGTSLSEGNTAPRNSPASFAARGEALVPMQSTEDWGRGRGKGCRNKGTGRSSSAGTNWALHLGVVRLTSHCPAVGTTAEGSSDGPAQRPTPTPPVGLGPRQARPAVCTARAAGTQAPRRRTMSPAVSPHRHTQVYTRTHRVRTGYIQGTHRYTQVHTGTHRYTQVHTGTHRYTQLDTPV
jgi:hypothetical protein